MSIGLLGTKVGMTRVFGEDGALRAVTVIKAGPCPVMKVRQPEEDGYSAIQVAFGEIDPDKLTKPMRGVYQVAGIDAHRHLAEFRCEGVNEIPAEGDVLTVDMFEPGELVSISGKSKGRGFSGVMKRHNYSGGRDAHGSNFHRAPGSIGTAATPSRVRKGTKLPGQFGNKVRTIRNIKVVDSILEDNLLLIAGGVPGAAGTLVKITKS